ncbi:hypothetical protein K8T06_09180 [bacterium]|nr:hypothetical protein [bacterium]
MRDAWKERFFRKMLWFGLPGISLFMIPVLAGAIHMIPLFIPILAIGLAFPFVELFTHFFPDVFFPYRWRDKPQPTFSIVRGLKTQKKYEEAMQELNKMTEEDPQEVDIWLEMLEIALMDLRDKTIAGEVYRDALSVLENQKSRDIVKRFYKNIVT